MWMYISLISGLIILIFAGDFLVRGAVGLAERLGIPPLIIGLTIVAFGTSAPELVVSVDAALEGASGIAIGNVVGSNIANILLVLGVPSIITVTYCDEEGALRSSVFMIFVTFVFIALCFMAPLGQGSGIILLILLFVFFWGSMRTAKRSNSITVDDIETIGGVEGVPHQLITSLVFIVIGFVGLPIAANLTVDGASAIAYRMGISDAAIGLSIIALGTSLPELATTVMAALRGQTAVGFGNAIGSNIFNLLAIMGITTVIAPVEVPSQMLHFDLWFMLLTSLAIVPFVVFCKPIGRGIGIAMVVIYLIYIMSIFV